MTWRNLLLGYDSITSTYTAVAQTALPSNNGYKLFAFNFGSSNSAPIFKWGFKSFYKTSNDVGFSIIFSRTKVHFYAYGRQNGKNLIGNFFLSNGA
jgi:hypothetical protein